LASSAPTISPTAMPIAGVIPWYIYNYFGTGSETSTADNVPGLVSKAGFKPIMLTMDFNKYNMYVFLSNRGAILKINIITNYVSLYAGTFTVGAPSTNVKATSSQIHSYGLMTVDKWDNLYFTYPDYNRVFVINSVTNVVSLFAGASATSGALGIGDGSQATSAYFDLWAWSGLVYSPVANAVYICDSYHRRVRKVSVATGIITNFAGDSGTASGCSGDGSQATAALLRFPAALAVDTVGNIYITDYFNNNIRKVSTSGIISTIAGIHSLFATVCFDVYRNQPICFNPFDYVFPFFLVRKYCFLC